MCVQQGHYSWPASANTLTFGFAGSQNYPDGPDKVAGFVDWHLIQAAQLDRIYTAGYFLGMLGLLAASLAACTATRQWPAVRVARRRVINV